MKGEWVDDDLNARMCDRNIYIYQGQEVVLCVDDCDENGVKKDGMVWVHMEPVPHHEKEDVK